MGFEVLGGWRGKGVTEPRSGEGGCCRSRRVGRGRLRLLALGVFTCTGSVVLAGLGRVVWFLYAEGGLASFLQIHLEGGLSVSTAHTVSFTWGGFWEVGSEEEIVPVFLHCKYISSGSPHSFAFHWALQERFWDKMRW